MYKKIYNPNTGKMVNTNSYSGKRILQNYINYFIKGGATSTSVPLNRSVFNEWIYILPKDSVLEHFKNKRSSVKNAEQFFCYFRNPESIECPWGKTRCFLPNNPHALSETVACKYIKYRTIKDLKLLAIPYKVVLSEDITQQDINLAKYLLSLTKNNCYRIAILKIILNDDSDAINQVKNLIDDPDFDYNYDYCKETGTLNHDYNLYRFMCELKQNGWDFDGWIRVIYNTETENIVEHIKNTPELTHEMDEVTLCNPIEDKLVIISSSDYTFIPSSD